MVKEELEMVIQAMHEVITKHMRNSVRKAVRRAAGIPSEAPRRLSAKGRKRALMFQRYGVKRC